MNSRALLLVLGSLLSVGLVALVARAGAGGDGPPGLEPPAGAVEAPAAPAQRTAARAAPADAVADPAPSGDRVALTTPGGGDGPRLRVVDAATGRPLPGAEVFFGEGRSFGVRDRDDAVRRLERFLADAPRATTDAAGEVALPPVERRLLVAARTAELFGVRTVDRGEEGATLALDADETLTVRVVDGRGEPRADVEVALAVDRIRGLQGRAEATTDADGIATIPHVQLLRTRMPAIDPALLAQATSLTNRVASLEQTVRVQRGVRVEAGDALRAELEAARRQIREVEGEVRASWRRQREAEQAGGPEPGFADFVVAAQVPQLAPTVRRFPAAAVPRGVVELMVGELGALEVRVLGPAGAPLLSPCRVEVRRSRENPLPGTVAPALVDSLDRMAEQRREKALGEPSVRFESVGAGVLLDVEVRFEDRDFTFTREGVEGPYAGGERVVEIVVPDWFSMVTGRLVGPEGAPRAGLRAELLVTGAAGRVEGETITVADDGRFELPFRLRDATGPFVLEVHARVEDDRRLGARVALPDLRGGRRHDAGDVVVAPLPVLAQGSVRDDRGQPIEGADVQLQAFFAGAGDEGGWRDVMSLRARTEADGTFRLHGDARSDAVRIRASAREHATVETAPIAFGATVDATLMRLGQLVVSGNLPGWLPRGAVQLEVERDGRVVRREDLRGRGDDGAFREAVRRLEPGAYRLTCSLRGIGTVLERPALVVPPGETVEVAAIDLRDAVFRYEVRAVDQAGEPLRDPGSPLLAQIVDPSGQLRWAAFPWRGDRVEFYSPERTSMIVALASGRRPVRMQIAPGESRLAMTQLHPLEVELPGLRAMVGERRTRISLVHTGDTGLPMEDLEAVDQARGRNRGYPRAALGKSGGAWLGGGEDAVVQVSLMLNGRYRVVARISEPGKRGNVSVDIGTVDAVLDGTAPQRVVVQAPPAVVQQALAELAAR